MMSDTDKEWQQFEDEFDVEQSFIDELIARGEITMDEARYLRSRSV